jgi:hypothetical protein
VENKRRWGGYRTSREARHQDTVFRAVGLQRQTGLIEAWKDRTRFHDSLKATLVMAAGIANRLFDFTVECET